MPDEDAFATLVLDAFEQVKSEFGDSLDNVVVVVEDWPDPDTLALAGARSRWSLLGFYHGVPLTQRGHGYSLVAPDRISIYRRPIERVCASVRDLRSTVTRVLHHEIGHHFGIDDDRLYELGAY
ncbi:MAG: metallopeptidase family protein [Anaerolineae bacterium]